MEFSLTMRLLNYFNQAWLKGWNTDLKKVDIHVDDRNDVIFFDSDKNMTYLKSQGCIGESHTRSVLVGILRFYDRVEVDSVCDDKSSYKEHIAFKDSMYTVILNMTIIYTIYLNYYNTFVSGLVYSSVLSPLPRAEKIQVSQGGTGSLKRTCHSCSTSLVHVAPATFLPVPPNPDEFTESTGVLADLEKVTFKPKESTTSNKLLSILKEKCPQ